MELVGTNLDLTKAMYQLFVKGDIATLMDHYHDDVVYHFNGTAQHPLTGHYEGKAGVLRFFQLIPENLDLYLFEPQEFLDAGNSIVIVGREGYRSKKTGKSAESPFVHIADIADGKLKRLRIFPDTAAGASVHVV